MNFVESDQTIHALVDPQKMKEVDRVPVLPVAVVLLSFAVLCGLGIVLMWFFYQNWATQISVEEQSQATYYDKDLQRAYESKILNAHLDQAIKVVLRKYALEGLHDK